LSNAFPWILILAVAASLAWLLLPTLAEPRRPTRRKAPPKPEAPFEAGLAALAGGLIGSRLGFAVTHTSYFGEDLWEIARLWRGGLSGPGAVLGAVCGIGLYAFAARQPFWMLADALAAPALAVAAAAWSGCLADACAYGLPASGARGLPALPGILQVRVPRWPTQAAGAVACLLALLLLLTRRGVALPIGVPALVALLAISLSGLAIAFVRGDPAAMLAGVRLEALGWAAIAVFGALAFALTRKAARRA
jgi:prolipoprotein diacylglyceryltransferase